MDSRRVHVAKQVRNLILFKTYVSFFAPASNDRILRNTQRESVLFSLPSLTATHVGPPIYETMKNKQILAKTITKQ